MVLFISKDLKFTKHVSLVLYSGTDSYALTNRKVQNLLVKSRHPRLIPKYMQKLFYICGASPVVNDVKGKEVPFYLILTLIYSYMNKMVFCI